MRNNSVKENVEVQLLDREYETCLLCRKSVLKYFCVDEKCLNREIICEKCSRENFNANSQHFLHKIVTLKQFLTQKNVNMFQDVIKKYQKFKENIEEMIKSWEIMTNLLKDLYIKIQNNLKNLKTQFSLSKTEELMANSRIPEKYHYYTNAELLQQMGKGKVASRIRKIQKLHKKFQLNLNSSFNNVLCDCMEHDLFQENLYIYSQSDIKNGNLENVNVHLENTINLSFLRNITNLNISSKIASSSYLVNIFENIPFLKVLKYTPSFEDEESRSLVFSHQNLQHLSINIQNYTKYFTHFLNSQNFPSLFKLTLENNEYFVKESIIFKYLSQDYSHIKYFSFVSLFIIKKELSEHFVNFLEGKNFYFVEYDGLNMNEIQSIKLNNYLNSMPLLLFSLTGQNMEKKNRKSWIYSIIQYRRYQYISRRTFKNIVLNILT